MSRKKTPKICPDGRALLNLACGFKSNHAWNNLDFSPYAKLARRKRLARWARKLRVISQLQYERVVELDPDVIVWDLRRGIPFADGSLDVVYHSHFLEHLDRGSAVDFLRECFRVLKPAGILRVVVPDLEILVENYRVAVHGIDEREARGTERYDKALYDLFDQMIRSKPGNEHNHGWLACFVQRLVRGNPAKTGELHRWAYDRISMTSIMSQAGFEDVRRHTATTSSIDGWNTFALDTHPDGTVYKADSLYMEGRKPVSACSWRRSDAAAASPPHRREPSGMLGVRG